MPSLARRLVAEAFGTFAVVFFSCAAVVMNSFPSAGYGLLGIALTRGIVLAVAVTATIAISGGVLNPALAIGLMAARRLDPRSGVAYIVVQLAAAVLAGLALQLILPAGVARVVGYGTPLIANSVTLGKAITIEAVLTFFLMSAMMGTAVSPEAPKVGGFGVGLTLFFCVLVGSPLTGAALNPGQAFGPAVISGVWVGHAAYWAGPILGALVAALFWEHLLLPKRAAA